LNGGPLATAAINNTPDEESAPVPVPVPTDDKSQQAAPDEVLPPPSSSQLPVTALRIAQWLPTPLPICTVSLCCAISAVFIHGMVQDDIAVSYSGPQVPSSEQYIYRTVSDFPACSDRRGQGSRLFIYPFAHIGYFHIVSNLISLLGYGCCLEVTNGHLSVVSFFIVGAIIGQTSFPSLFCSPPPLILPHLPTCPITPIISPLLPPTLSASFSSSLSPSGGLGHSFLYPYIGLVGASCGVYGVIGGLTACCVFGQAGVVDVWRKQLVLSIALSIQIFVDVICYFYYYQPSVGYAGHFFGFVAGLTLSFAQGHILSKEGGTWWKKALNILGFLSLSLLVSFLIYNRVANYPPLPPKLLSSSDTFHFYDKSSCCLALFNIVNATYSLDQARENHVCTG
jgi:membrane associated rhomboid family serine protease